MSSSLPDQTLGLEGTVQQLARCAALTLVIVLSPSVAAANEDREQFCTVVGAFAEDHADDRGRTLTRAIGDQFASLARYSKASIAGDFRLVARFYRLKAQLGSSKKAAKVLEVPLAEITAARVRAVDYELALCRPDLADPARMRG